MQTGSRARHRPLAHCRNLAVQLPEQVLNQVQPLQDRELEAAQVAGLQVPVFVALVQSEQVQAQVRRETHLQHQKPCYSPQGARAGQSQDETPTCGAVSSRSPCGHRE